jgi:hypothetical protein
LSLQQGGIAVDLDQPGAGLAAAFARDGVACVRGVLDPAGIAAAVAAIEMVLAVPGPLAQVASGLGDPGSFIEDFRRWQDVPQIEGLARYSRVPQIAAALMGTPQVRFYHDHVLVKEGGTRQRTPWHQDQPYYNESPARRSDRVQYLKSWSSPPSVVTIRLVLRHGAHLQASQPACSVAGDFTQPESDHTKSAP